LGFRPTSRHRPAASTFASIPLLASFRPRSFSLPRRLPPPLALQVYFTLQPRPGFSLQGFPLRRSRTSSSEATALLSFDAPPYRPLARAAPDESPCLQGLALRRNPMPSREGLAHVTLDPLLGFSSSGCSLHRLCIRFHGCSAHGLCVGTFKLAPTAAFSVSTACGPTEVSRPPTTRSRFPACDVHGRNHEIARPLPSGVSPPS
jgi:hypothetical protein